MKNESQSPKKSALLIIGNEILSGRTLDKNTQYIGEKMSAHGVPLSEVRVVPDIEDEIVDALNALRGKYDFVFTTGGIGPTHDDITAARVAGAFSVDFGRHAGAYDILLNHYGEADLTEARASMADMPVHDDMDLILNPVSAAPGFRVENVFVMAGVPRIMQAMLDNVLQMIAPGQAMHSRTVHVDAPESKIAKILGDLQDEYSDVDIGSYPQFKPEGGWGVSVVLRGVDDERLRIVKDALLEVLQEKSFKAEIVG